MDTNKLKYFVAVAETGSLTKASKILGISHSGLSKAVSALETEAKLKLFRPQGRGLEITLEGKWFYLEATASEGPVSPDFHGDRDHLCKIG